MPKSSLALSILTMLLCLSLWACATSGPPALSCVGQGGHGLFVGLFDNDSPGSLPAPTAPLVYGPPGAGLDVQGPAGTVLVINSATLNSNALQITRGQPNSAIVSATVGDLGGGAAPYKTGVYEIRFRAHGAIVPGHSIAAIGFALGDSDDEGAFAFRLVGGAYEALVGGSYTALSGGYDPTIPHSVLVEVDMNRRVYGLCVDQQALIQNQPFLDSAFDDVKTVRFLAPPTITEANPAELVIDEFRIVQRLP